MAGRQRPIRRIVRWALVFATAVLAGIVLAPAAGAQAEPERRQIVFETEPALAGIPFIVNGEEYRTNSFGFVSVSMEVNADHRIAIPEVIPVDRNTRYLFARWNDSFEPTRTVRLGSRTRFSAGIYIQHRVGFQFVDGLGEPVAKSTIQSAIMLNSNGNEFTLSNDADEEDDPTLEEAWFIANRVRRTGAGLSSKPAEYVFNRVFVEGLNVVQSGAVGYTPLPGEEWRVELLLFPLEIDVRSFVFNRGVEAEVELYQLEDPSSAPPLRTTNTKTGLALFEQLPRGDYEARVIAGGAAPDTPIIFTGPKTEQITVLTAGLLWFVGAIAILGLVGAYLFVTRPVMRLPIVGIAGALIMVLFSVPNIGSVLNRPLSAEASPIYDSEGRFMGFEIEVTNKGATTLAQVYCKPDFELRILGETSIWTATFESNDFHDVEMGTCREHRVGPGVERHVLVPELGQEWTVTPAEPLEPGTYQAFVRIFDIPAQMVTVDVRNGLLDDLIYVTPSIVFEEIPFANPFEE